MKRKKALSIINDALTNMPESYSDFDNSKALAPWGNGERWDKEYTKGSFTFYLGTYDAKGDKVDWHLVLSAVCNETGKEIASVEKGFREVERWHREDANELIRDLTLVLKGKAEELEKQILKCKGAVMKPVDPDVRHLTDIFECSKCGSRVHLGEYMKEYEYEFCPNCGRPIYSESE